MNEETKKSSTKHEICMMYDLWCMIYDFRFTMYDFRCMIYDLRMGGNPLGGNPLFAIRYLLFTIQLLVRYQRPDSFAHDDSEQITRFVHIKNDDG